MPIPSVDESTGYLGSFFIVNQYYLYASIYSFNCSYLLLQKICTDLRFDNICRNQSVLYYDCTNFFFEIEQEVIRDFDCSKFVFCSDAGLGSKTNRQFNDIVDKSYVITQPLKKLKFKDREISFRQRFVPISPVKCMT